jgi:hypothetical protein
VKLLVPTLVAAFVLGACSKATPTAQLTPSTAESASPSPSPAPSFSPSPSPCVTPPPEILATLDVANKDLVDVIDAAKRLDLKGIIAKERDAARITSAASKELSPSNPAAASLLTQASDSLTSAADGMTSQGLGASIIPYDEATTFLDQAITAVKNAPSPAC